MFCSGFQTCAREVLQFLAKHEHARDLKSSQLVTHLHRVVAELLQGGAPRKASDPAPKAADFKEKPGALAKGSEGPGKNCVPVIQRTFAPLERGAERQRHGHGQRLRRRVGEGRRARGAAVPQK